MSAELIIESLGRFCKESTGDFQRLKGNKSTYHWNRGRDNSSGYINGVVRKLAGVTDSGQEIWVVAGSFKISPTGQILRFTGLTKENWRTVEQGVLQQVSEVETV